MKNKYKDLIEQTFEFPNDEFDVIENDLEWFDVPLMDVIKQYGTPLRIAYLPKIGANIQKARRMFNVAMAKVDYNGDYNYCYCTKSSHFSFVMEEVIKHGVHLETSSAFDINIMESLHEQGLLKPETYVICNGFKRPQYVENIQNLMRLGFTNVIPVLDNKFELDLLLKDFDLKLNVGIRIAAEEEPKFDFYTSRLGIRYNDIIPYYLKNIASNPQVGLKMLHFFINTGVKDTAYYWNELNKAVNLYCELKKKCPELDSLNIGGGFPIKNSLAFDYDYQYMVDEILNQIKIACDDAEVPVPHIFTEFGSFTVGEAGGAIYQVLYQKKQNDRENWNMIDSSFITTLPDTWAINKRFVMMAVNRWNDTYERVLLGGLTCDGDDYYNSEQHMNAVYLPKYNKEKPLYIGFFNTGAYQETIGGFGGLSHCILPQPKHILIDKDKNGIIATEVFSEQQKAEDVLEILGYNKKKEQ